MMRARLSAAVLAILSLAAAVPAFATCSEDRVTLRGPGGQAAFTVEIADTDAERSLGLMHRDSMPRFAGMLFVFDAPQHAVFWMENTLIPLDMLFIDETGVVLKVHENAIPLDRTGIDGGFGVHYVLEINGGMARTLGIESGTELRSPLLDQEIAVWPCD